VLCRGEYSESWFVVFVGFLDSCVESLECSGCCSGARFEFGGREDIECWSRMLIQGIGCSPVLRS
jgi:hypothetical protein